MRVYFESIVKEIEKKINTGVYKKGTKFPSTRELSALYDCSVNTVEKAIKSLVQNGSLVRQERKGTFIANTANVNVNGAGVIVAFVPSVSHPLHSKALRGIEDVAKEKGYGLMIASNDGSIEKTRVWVRDAIDKKVDGVIMCPVHEAYYRDENLKFIDQLVANGIKVVCYDRHLNNMEVPYVTSDNIIGTYNLIEHLIKNGHEKIMIIRNSNISTIIERWAGYRQALLNHNIRYRENLDIYMNSDETVTEIFKNKLKMALMNESYTAIYATNDTIAISIIEILDELGIKIPKDISLTCHDPDASYITMARGIYGVSQPYYDMGRVAAEILFEKILLENNEKSLVGNICRSTINCGKTVRNIIL